MLVKRLPLLLLAPLVASANDWRPEAPNPSSVIEASMCIPAISGQGCLHVDEDVANLVIEVAGCDGQVIATYDDPTEQEDVAAPGTGAHTAPSANNVRVSPQGGAGSDLTEMQFADTVYAGENCVTIDVSDGMTTIMDFQRKVIMVDESVRGVRVGTCDSGTTTTCVDAERTEADDDYWQKGIGFMSTSGSTQGQISCVYDFNAAADRITFRPALTQAISTNSYVLIPSPICAGVKSP